MKLLLDKFLIYGLVFFVMMPLFGQGTKEGLAVKIATPVLDAQIDGSMTGLFEERVRSLFSQLGILGNQYEVLTVCPELYLMETGELEGMEKRLLCKLRFSIQVKNRLSGAIISTESQILSASGQDRAAAVRKAISGIKPGHKRYEQWLENLQERWTIYYNEHCAESLAEAKTAAERKEYDKAVALLKAVPSGSTCADQSQAALLGYYGLFQEQQCRQALHQAEVAMQQEKFAEAIDYLSTIDPESSCGPDAQLMLRGAGRGLDKQSYAKYQFLNKVYEDKLKLEAARQQNMEQISEGYLKGRE